MNFPGGRWLRLVWQGGTLVMVFRREIQASLELVYDVCRRIDLHEALSKTIAGRAVEGRTKGLFRNFGHEYRLRVEGGVVVLEDRFTFQCPAGFLGSSFGRWVLLPRLRKVQEERMEGLKNFCEGERRYEVEISGNTEK